MRGWSSLLVGLGLLALGVVAYLMSGFSGATIFCAATGAVLTYHGVRGVGIGAAGDATALADFITNPAAAMMDAAVDKAGEVFAEKPKPAADETPAFDPDAVLARYMANRPERAPVAAAEARPPARGFGRKGL